MELSGLSRRSGFFTCLALAMCALPLLRGGRPRFRSWAIIVSLCWLAIVGASGIDDLQIGNRLFPLVLVYDRTTYAVL